MKKAVEEYAAQIRKLQLSSSVIGETAEILEDVPQLMEELSNPTVSLEKRHRVIDRIFPNEIRDFLKLLCDKEEISLFLQIAEERKKQEPVKQGTVLVELSYVQAPSEEQLEGIREFLKKKYHAEQLTFSMKQDASLEGGFILRIGNDVYDWSRKGRLEQLKEAVLTGTQGTADGKGGSLEGIISILKSEIFDFDLEAKEKEVGVVNWVGDGIANVDGIEHAVYGEIVIFDSGVKGMVQDIRRDEIGCILFGSEREIREGTRVVRTGKRAGMPVGDAFLGRIIDPLGAPIDGKGAIASSEFRPIENEAPGIVDRKSVSVPLETGILSIDSMFPIGRGQRELIIGDRQTGKTSIAVDTMINQKDKDVICIYVAIGQKASTIAQLVGTLKKQNAMDHTIIVAATASDSAPLQYIAPYSATALAESFMYQGKDVLIVYDDLSKHAVAYRAISLLLERPPGREAYPGDVFYLHSRLLERSSRLSEEAGGGSITALPIIETQAGDVSAYIPTNVISITDGQIFLESDLFFSGMRPAVNVGLSVSRVGGAAQTKAMKKAAGSIRIDLAQYREMEVFTQFSSDLDAGTKAQLAHGKALMELLKQPLCHPLSMEEQVLTLVAAQNGIFARVEPAKVKELQGNLLKWFECEHKDLLEQIRIKKTLEEDLKKEIDAAIRTFGEQELPKE